MKKLLLLSAMAGMFAMTSCTDDTASNGTATMAVRLTDAPANYDALNIDVQKIEFFTNSGMQAATVVNPGIYNLLNFRNGTDVLLAQVQLPEGSLSQMRLVLGENNTVVIDGVEHKLSTPSAMQSGLKFNWHETLEAGGAYEVWIDFDAARSIVKQGNGTYALKPVIRTFSKLTDGQIKGYLKPAEANGSVHVLKATDTVATAIPNLDGFYMFKGLAEGSYTVSFDADDKTGYKDQDTTSIGVTFGKITDLGTTTLIK